MKIIIESKKTPNCANNLTYPYHVAMEQVDGILKPEIYSQIVKKLEEIQEIMNSNQSLIFQQEHV